MNLDTALWALGRGTGLVSLALFTGAVVLGIVSRSGRPLGRLGRLGSSDLHRTVAMTAVGMVVLHLVSLLFDSYAQLRVVDLVVPFLGTYRPLWLGLGTLAVDILLVVTVVSLLRTRVSPRLFRLVHYSVYAMWPIALGHSLGIGTDAGSLAMNVFIGINVALVAASCGWRLMPSYAGRGRVRTQRRVMA